MKLQDAPMKSKSRRIDSFQPPELRIQSITVGQRRDREIEQPDRH